MHSEITIRHATDNDVTAVRHLAALDESDAPQGDALLAFVDGELVAARSVRGLGRGGRSVPPHAPRAGAAGPAAPPGAGRVNPMLTWEVACWHSTEVRRVSALRRAAAPRRFFPRF